MGVCVALELLVGGEHGVAVEALDRLGAAEQLQAEFGFPVACVVNPEAGLEAQWQSLHARPRPAARR